jgi:hypothetical protein
MPADTDFFGQRKGIGFGLQIDFVQFIRALPTILPF